VLVTVNEGERKRWNDARWADMWPNREQLTDTVTPILLEVVAPQTAERILDIGSGGGKTALGAAELVGDRGAVVGADISEPLVALSTARAREAGVSNVAFTLADVQTDRVRAEPFDAVMSQFGIMFFDDPVQAFTNIADHLVPQGRLVFACWQPIQDNPWHIGPTLGRFTGPPPPPGPGKSPTGPFVFGDPAQLFRILEDSGFIDSHRTAHELVVRAKSSAIFDDGQLIVAGVSPDVMDEANAAMAAHVRQFAVGVGLYDFPLAFQIITARRG
jgi:SAM-dependent methyltransferase